MPIKRFLPVILLVVVFLGGMILFSQRQNDAVNDVPTGSQEEFRLEKEIFLKKERDVVYYGIHVNASDEILRLEDLPTESVFENGADITPKVFVTAVLSPDTKQMAFAIKGNVNSWNGIVDMESREIEQLTILKKNLEPSLMFWSLDGESLVTENLILATPPRRFLTLIGVSDRTLLVDLVPPSLDQESELDIFDPVWAEDSQTLIFQVRILPDGEVSAWQVNRDGTGYFKVQ